MQPQKYRGKPVVIEAMQLTPVNRAAIIDWIGPNDLENRDQFDPNNLYIKNEHGVVVAEMTDWVIKGSRGEFYPCKDSTFKEKYEPAPAPAVAPTGAQRK